MGDKLNNIASKLSIPAIAVSDTSRITAEDGTDIIAEGVHRILSVEPDSIRMLTRKHSISVEGNNLQLKLISNTAVSISGAIESIGYKLNSGG